jgi:hypothetical protein
MSVAFTNLYAALVKTLQSVFYFFAMTQRISPAAVIVDVHRTGTENLNGAVY